MSSARVMTECLSTPGRAGVEQVRGQLSLVGFLARLGCTRIGSPGIFG